MLIEFFLDQARIELASDGLSYLGSVPDLPEIQVEAASSDECRLRLEEAIGELLSGQASTTPVASLRPEETPGRESAKAVDADAPFSEIVYEKNGLVATVMINRPEAYNAYSARTLREMARAFRDAAADDRVAVLVLTGAGKEAFCTGSDISEHAQEHLGDPEKSIAWTEWLIEAHEALRKVDKPTVARINGIVAGGGNEWNLACDLAIAADHSKFVHVETKFGMSPESGAVNWLPLLIGDRRAREMVMTGEPVSAEKALAWGLVNEITPFDQLDAAVGELCGKLVEHFPESLRYARKQLNFWKDLVWDSAIKQARETAASRFTGAEALGGIAALSEHRRIDYRVSRHASNVRRSLSDGPE